MTSIFEQVKAALAPRLPEVLADLLPGGRISGRDYVCASLQGDAGTSCATNLETGKGSDFATGESWGDVIALAAKVWNMRQGKAAQELARRYHVDTGQNAPQPIQQPAAFSVILPVPESSPEPPRHHAQHGQASALWRYADGQGRTLGHVARFETPEGKVILPLCFGHYGTGRPQWVWKALPEPRPLYGLPGLQRTDSPVLLVEGEKTADAAQALFPQYAVLTWSGGANAVGKADWSPLTGRVVIIWPDNDEPGFKGALEIASLLKSTAASIRVVLPSASLPEKWDVADPAPEGFNPHAALQDALTVEDFYRSVSSRNGGHMAAIQVDTPPPPDTDDLTLKEWPRFSWDACPGLLGDFVRLATRNSEADPAAVCVTALVRFGAEVYSYGGRSGLGPHFYIGETIHPPRLFAVICGNSSKARKGTSRHPVTKLFGREHCQPADLKGWGVALSARESGGPLSTGEGLAHHVRDETDEERERHQRQNPNEPIREKGDKRLIILDEEFASGLACTKREGNTLSMGIRCFWDSGDYAPLTKNNPVTVRGAHISILTHITMQELAVCLGEVQAVNGFGNRFLWVCARRAKLVPLPARMPDVELAPLQRELWRLVGLAQRRGTMTMTPPAVALWESLYTELSQEHSGLAGSIINRAEAQTLRLALIYALLDGAEQIAENHLKAALAMWNYAQESALYIFGDRVADPLEEKVLEALKAGPLTATELSAALNRHVPRERLQPLLQQLEGQQRISIQKQKNAGRPRLIIALRVISEQSEKGEFSEKREARS
ncbi:MULTISPECIES: DUF6371 domain-containing protein [Desulfovibrionaceae]|uniref:DUF6371 domain-containing protein n=1 Tax=Desulfovibrionaceae TaxID=194924 RepID=UPI001F14E93C|nr:MULTISPECIES: DUF6371 domain-containing protein [Desulfovibrionaceae]